MPQHHKINKINTTIASPFALLMELWCILKELALCSSVLWYMGRKW